MAEINIKSPAIKDRVTGTLRIPLKVTVNATSSTTDIPGITLVAAGTTACCGTPTLTFSGIECATGLALDSSREAGINILELGTIANASQAEAAQMYVVSNAIAGTAGSRTLAFVLDTAGTELDLGTDTFTGAMVELIIPVKNKDF